MDFLFVRNSRSIEFSIPCIKYWDLEAEILPHHDEPIYCFLLIQLDMKEKVKIPNTLEYME
jgi:hypothetical protein